MWAHPRKVGMERIFSGLRSQSLKTRKMKKKRRDALLCFPSPFPTASLRSSPVSHTGSQGIYTYTHDTHTHTPHFPLKWSSFLRKHVRLSPFSPLGCFNLTLSFSHSHCVFHHTSHSSWSERTVRSLQSLTTHHTCVG